MSVPPNLVTVYQARRKDLVDQLSRCKSKVAKEQLRIAIFVTDATAATIHDIAVAVQAAGKMMRKQVDKDIEHVTYAKDTVENAIEDLASSESSALLRSISLLTTVAQLQAKSASDRVNATFLQWDLLIALGFTWMEGLHSLYTAPSREIFFTRIEKLVEFASSKLPVVGDILDILKVAGEVYAAKIKQAEDADKYLSSLESYVDASNLYLVGVMSFCAEVECLCSGDDTPNYAEIEDRIARHIESIGSGNHPVSTQRRMTGK